MPDTYWAKVKHSRADLAAMCRLPLDIGAAEFERRVHAFNCGAYNNLTVALFGRTFRIECNEDAARFSRGKSC